MMSGITEMIVRGMTPHEPISLGETRPLSGRLLSSVGRACPNTCRKL
jgi:hypothetical protein